MLYEIGKHLEGLPRHISIHAAGIVMSRKPIDEIIPLYKNSIGIYTTAYSKDYLEPLGDDILLKKILSSYSPLL